jgi:hypothetical protein
MTAGVESSIKLVVHLKGQLTQLIFQASPAGLSSSEDRLNEVAVSPLWRRVGFPTQGHLFRSSWGHKHIKVMRLGVHPAGAGLSEPGFEGERGASSRKGFSHRFNDLPLCSTSSGSFSNHLVPSPEVTL